MSSFTIDLVKLFHQLIKCDDGRKIDVAFPFFVVGGKTTMDHFISIILEPSHQKLQFHFDRNID